MTENSTPPGPVTRFARWATTPPQAYGVYLGAVVLVFLLAFYAGTLKPKSAPGTAPPITAPKG